MSLALQLADPIAADGPRSEPTGLLAELLREQHATAVDKYAQWHSRETSPLQAWYYRALIPFSTPQAGEQYAFEVDLDACTGCQACVVACHNLNGLEEQETWRSVGQLHGGSTSLPVMQHVTAACHHCLEPACLDGCPVEAYEKDPITGIVRHLDDQCIGCQYCILKCPYDVPKFSHAKGIVRKCDMCSSRLAVGEAPACVQACPNEVIRITVVNREEVAENAEANLFLQGAPEPSYTLPTTIYKTSKPLPANLLPADYYSANSQRSHWPLVLMLVLTQMSVGAFLTDQVIRALSMAGGVAEVPAMRTLHLGAAFVLGMIGLSASVFHLGRPWLAYRAIIAWRTSWLSREVLAFGGFAASALVYAALPWLEAMGLPISAGGERVVGGVVALSGLAGVVCSAMIYASTRRVFWNPAYTGLKFSLTCLVLGIPVALLMQLAAAIWASPDHFVLFARGRGHGMCVGLITAAAMKLLAEAAVFSWLSARTFTPLRRTALLMTGQLVRSTLWRFIAGALGGILLPACVVWMTSRATFPSPLRIVAAVAASLVLVFVGELLERYLFFAAVVAPKMPGAPAA